MESANIQQRVLRQPVAPIGQAERERVTREAPEIQFGPVFAHWRLITAATIGAVLATFIATTFLMTRWYQATAVIRPSSDSSIGRQLSLGGELPLQGLGEAMLGGGLSQKAEEYVAILDSFAFNTSLIKRHQLASALLVDYKWQLYPHDSQWDAYRTLQRRFDAAYSYRTDLITLSLRDRSREHAAKVLGYYIDDLRAQLREREIQSTTLAINAIEEQVSKTADALLLNRLYELIAEQLKRNRLAQVQADYSFAVIDPPSTPDWPYRPLVLMDCLLVGLVTPLAIALLMFVIDAIRRARRAENGEYMGEIYEERVIRSKFD